MKDCYYSVTPIPENYEGTLTIGTTGITTAGPINIHFQKGSTAQIKPFVGTVSAAGVVQYTVTATDNDFFSSAYDYYRVSVWNTNNDPVKLVESTQEFNYLQLPFARKDCDIVAYPYTLKRDTESPCQSC